MKKIKKETLVEALYRLQRQIFDFIEEEYPNQQYPKEWDDRISDTYGIIDLLEDWGEEKI